MIMEFKNRGTYMCELTKERKREIEKCVNNLLDDIDFKKTPYVDIVAMAKKDGFVVEAHKMDIDTTGCLFMDDTTRTIWVNTIFRNSENEDDVVFKKSRFITAHEYGHYKLHNFMTVAHRDTDHRTEQIELEADYFARSILMPLQYFRDCYKVLNIFYNGDKPCVVDTLSKFFRVTKNKVDRRINDLEELLA